MAAAPPGVTLASGVELLPEAVAFLAKLRSNLESSVPIVVTSAGRTIDQQASAMLKKYQAGGAQELYDVYASDATITKLVAAPKTVESWAAIIRAEAARGIRLSRHLAGGALDLRTRQLTEAQLTALVAAVKAAGGRPLLEDAPPHLHVDLPGSGSGMAQATSQVTAVAVRAAMSPWTWGALAASAGLALVLVGIGRRRRARASPPETLA